MDPNGLIPVGSDPQRDFLSVGGRATLNRPNTERPKPIYHNIYSLPIAENDPKDPTWSAQNYPIPPDPLFPPEFQPSDFYEGLSSSIVNDAHSTTFADSLGLLTEHADPPSNVRKKPRLIEQQQLTLNTNVSAPFAFSPYSVSSSTPPLDFNFSAFSEAPSSCSTFTPQSSLYFSPTPLSPTPASRRHSDIIRLGNRSRATPSPRSRPQSSPYSLDVSRRRMSHSSTASFPPYVPSPFMGSKPPNSSAYTSPQIRGSQFFPTPLVPPQPGSLPPGSMFPNSTFPGTDPYSHRFMIPEPIASQRIPRTLRSDIDPDQAYFEDYAGLSEPPDLLGPLKDTPLSPPPEDMMPSDPTMVPHEQDLRFDNDLYTPKWVRGHGNKREGWCGICKPGRWLVLKNSAFWYDKSFTHGISAVTGQAFAAPKEIRRTEGSANIWEGLCGNCGQWVGLVTSKKKGTTWFRHAYKCHNHYKPDDSLKRQRDNDESRTVSSLDAYSKSPQSATASKPESISPRCPSAAVSKNPLEGLQGVSSIQSMLSMI
ncbi:hypothetical protein PRK78_000709 [Emydomyces testavorans]|uniref:Transcription regulator Rua1 C-terminal domain-containing protein n=1 Tax=Emydomyces testavorans TaxID=2070801 RepID=A0AAF0DC02_9EURO|nr:hypothetical protein PRK78_000709 [Emydomyces testavorans]